MSGRAKNKAVLPTSAALTFGQIKRNMGNVSEVESLPCVVFSIDFSILILDLHMSLVLSLAIIPSLLDTHWIV